MPKQKSNTDWDRVKHDAATEARIEYDPEEPYDPNDEEATEKFLSQCTVRYRGQRAAQKSPTKELISIRLSPEVRAYFRSTGDGWQTRIDDVLKKAVHCKSRR